MLYWLAVTAESPKQIFLNRGMKVVIACHHHPHNYHVVPLARISLTLFCHFSISFIASGWSSGLHPVSTHSCCIYVRAGRPAFARPYVGVHRSTSLMSSTLFLQQCPARLVWVTWIVFVMGGRWPYSWCLVRCCCLDLFNIARNRTYFRVIYVNVTDKLRCQCYFDFRKQFTRTSCTGHLKIDATH